MKIIHWLWAKITNLLYRFRWYRWQLYQRRLKAKPRTEITHVFTIYAHEFGSDVTGDGVSVATAYRTLARAIHDIPNHVPPGVRYVVDVTGLYDENLPTEFNAFASEEAERREREIRQLQEMLIEAETKKEGSP